MKNTNVKLSENELELVTDASFILTKNEIIGKVYNLFGFLSEDYKKLLEGANTEIPVEVLKISPKIYKGERYLELPYVMLDYPRFFMKEEVFAIRSFFWWGNFFSISLLLTGKYQQQYLGNILNQLKLVGLNNWFAYKGDDIWKHNFIAEQYLKLDAANSNDHSKVLQLYPFFKITKILPLQKWDEAYYFFNQSYKELLQLLKR